MATCNRINNDIVLAMTEAEAQEVLAAVGCLGSEFTASSEAGDSVQTVLSDALPLAGRRLVRVNGFGQIVPA